MTISKWCDVAIVALSAAALTGCLDAADDDAELAGVAEQAVVTSRELRLVRIQARNLNEGGDEIFLTASRSEGGSVNIIRRSGDPDYWRFDDEGVSASTDKHVGTILPTGLLIVNLQEQDPGPPEQIGTIDFQLDHNGAVKLFNTPTGFSRGTDTFGIKVEFIGASADYWVWFKTVP